MTVIGRTECNIDRRANWEVAYRGYLMAVRSSSSSSLSAPTNTICMDEGPETAETNIIVSNQSPQITYVKSGSGLPWASNRVLPCTVCIRVA